MNYFKNIIIPVLILSVLVSCKNEKKKTDEHAETEEHSHSDVNLVSLTESQIQSIGLELGVIEQKELKNTIKANGFLKVPNQSKATVTSLFSGQIRSIKVRPGDMVKKGQTLAVIENPNSVQTQEQYLTVVAQINLAQTEVKRQKELYQGNAGALKNLQYAESQLKTLQIQKFSLVKQLQLMGISPSTVSAKNINTSMAVKAPISGVVGAVLVDIGSFIDISTPIAEIVDNTDLHLDLNVFEKDLPKIRTGQTIHFTMTNNPTKEYDAEIFSIGSTFEDQSNAIPVHARVRGETSNLIDGMNVVAVISIGESLVPAVPTESIVNSGAEDFIFILDHKEETGNVFRKVPVAKGVSDVGFSQITPLITIPEDSQLVVKGAFFLMAKMNNAGEEGHSH